MLYQLSYLAQATPDCQTPRSNKKPPDFGGGTGGIAGAGFEPATFGL
jgi:hypothetical protein